jgi:hypothetical protein
MFVILDRIRSLLRIFMVVMLDEMLPVMAVMVVTLD